MSFFNIDSQRSRTYDAIVIGSGISGGWAAKELTERGFKTLVIERGRDVKHPVDYPTTNMQPWEFEHRNEPTYTLKSENPIASRCYAFREDSEHFFVKDKEQPYIQDKPFDWIRGYQLEENHYYGPDRHSVGATLILPDRQETALQSTGQLGTKTWNHGMLMLKDL